MLKKERAESENKHGNGPFWGNFEENMVGVKGQEDPMNFINMDPPKDKYMYLFMAKCQIDSLVTCRLLIIFLKILSIHL